MNQPIMSQMKKVELQDFLTGIWNVRSMYRAGYLTIVITEFERYGLNIVTI